MATSPLSEVVQHLRRATRLRESIDLTDGQLVERFVGRREEAAIEALVLRYAPMVWGVCCRILRNQHDAEDAFQATFLVLVRKAASIVPRERVGNWLYGVANQTARKVNATLARRRGREKQVTEMPEPAEPGPDRSREVPWEIDEELCRLPDKYRTVILLCDVEGKTRKEVARQLGCPEGTVAGRLTRGRVMLAKRLARHGRALSGGSLAAVLAQNEAAARMPTSLVSLTIRSATLVAAGQAMVTGLVSSKVAALTEGVLNAMWLTKLTVIAALVLTLGILGTGASILTLHALAAGQAGAKKAPAAKPEVKVPDAPPVKPREDREMLRGTWHVVEVQVGGKHRAEEASKDQIWVFTRDKLVITYDDGSSQELTYLIDPKQTPKAIDLTSIAERSTFKGIYELDGDRLQLYYSRNVAPDAKRPARFDPEFEDRGMRSFVLRRAPVAKKAPTPEPHQSLPAPVRVPQPRSSG